MLQAVHGVFGGPAAASIGDVDHRASPDLPDQRLGWAGAGPRKAECGPALRQEPVKEGNGPPSGIPGLARSQAPTR